MYAQQSIVREVARVPLPTPFGEFEARAFTTAEGGVYLALVRGEVGDGEPVLTRLHSECLTGDALGSLRCDCGPQLRWAMRAVAAAGRGVVLYATGQEGRGIGLVNKLRAYMEQDSGFDTVDANLRLGLPVDARDYGEAAAVLRALGIASVRLLTNNPDKVSGLQQADLPVVAVEPAASAPHARNLPYLQTKERRLGHVHLNGSELPRPHLTGDVATILGTVHIPSDRPYLVLKYAQTVDGRIATRTGDSKWISSEEERRVSHALRAACDAILVGVGTVLRDDPRLTVRLVPGVSPLRVVLDSKLTTPSDAHVLDEEAATILVTTTRSDAARRETLQGRGVGVQVVDGCPDGVDIHAALRRLRELGTRTLLVEGGARVITSLLRAKVVDRLVVAVAPTILGAGRDAVGELGIGRVADGLRLDGRSVHLVGEDVLIAGDLRPPGD